MALLLHIKNLLRTLGFGESRNVRELKSVLNAGQRSRDPSDRLSTVIFDYPVLVDLCKAYAEAQDWESAEEVVRTCFKLREEYAADYGGFRDAYLVQRLAREFIKNGRDDIALKVLRKVQNFEQGVPVSQLSGEFFPDQDLRQQIEEQKRNR